MRPHLPRLAPCLGLLACVGVGACGAKAAWAEQPPCLPAVLALSTTPVGSPVPGNTYLPTFLNAPLQDGLAVFWHCQVGNTIKVLEVHGTPQSIAQHGGLPALHSAYARDQRQSWDTLDATGHACVDPAPNPRLLASRADCHALPAKVGGLPHYVCVNPAVVNPPELKLCGLLVREIAAQWPR